MVNKKPKILHIREPRQLRALRTPLRQELLQTLFLNRSASVKELAGAVGKPPASLYYHIHEMERVGLIRRAATRRAGTRTEVVYEPAAGQIRVDRTVRSRAFLDALHDLHRAALNQASREVGAAIAATGKSGGQADESVMLVRLSARLTPRDAKEIQRMLNELAAFMNDHNDPGRGETFALTAALARLV